MAASPEAGIKFGDEVYSSPEKAALARFPNTLALNEAWAVDGVLEQPEKVIRNPRRTSGDLRQDMKKLGAFFLAVEQKPQAAQFGLDPFKGAGAADIHPESWERVRLTHQVWLPSTRCLFCISFTFSATSDLPSAHHSGGQGGFQQSPQDIQQGLASFKGWLHLPTPPLLYKRGGGRAESIPASYAGADGGAHGWSTR